VGSVHTWLCRIRVRDWAHFLVLPLAGAPTNARLSTFAPSLARGVVTAFCVLAFGYLLNGIADRHMDDPAKNALAGDRGAAGRAVLLAIALAAAALVLSAFGPAVALGATLVCLASGSLYSIGPRLKAYPVLGTLMNGTHFAPLLLVGAAPSGAPGGVGVLALTFVALLLQNQLLHEAADASDDERGRVLTTTRLFGVRAAAWLSAALGTAAAAAVAGAGHPLAGVVAGLVFVGLFPALLLKAGANGAAMRGVRRAHRVASAIAGAALFASLHAA
jgi:4-hydroxybenzoate polyprenyltransferase